MKIIGIAGESGTGKSTIASALATRYNGIHIDADRVGHGVLEHRDVIEAIRRRFGGDVFDALGRVDRRALGARVFSDEAARLDLNAIIHPGIRRACGELVGRARKSGMAAVVVDAALLLDSQMPFEFDLMIALRCAPDTRYQRIMAKGGWTAEQVKARMANQQDIEKSFYKADVVVDTDGELPDVLKDIYRRVEEILGR